jgi:RNA polymerase sigma-70 factor (ECF subfamily)
MENDDQAERLAAASRDGDREAFSRLYDLYAKRIYAYLYYRSLDRESAQDLTSAVFLKALEGLAGFRPELGGFSRWIYGIARNALRDHFRALSRTVSLEGAADLWDFPDAGGLPAAAGLEIEAENRDLWERLKPHFAALPSEQREILILRTWDELPYKDIAQILGKSENACKMSYSRSLARLREAMPLCLLLAFLLASKPPIA